MRFAWLPVLLLVATCGDTRPTSAVSREQVVEPIIVPCSDVAALTDAIRTSNAEGGAHVISLQACDYILTTVATDQDLGFWFGPNGLPLITSDITINGNGARIRRSSAGGTPPFRIFAVAGAGAQIPGVDPAYPPAGSLTLRDLTLEGGLARGGDGGDGAGGGAGLGGAILAQGAVRLERVTITNCEARGGDGGGAGGAGGGGGLGGAGGAGNAGGGGGGGFTGLGGAGGDDVGGGGGGGGASGNGAAGSGANDGGGGGTTGDASGETGGDNSIGEPWGDGGNAGTNGDIGGGGGGGGSGDFGGGGGSAGNGGIGGGGGGAPTVAGNGGFGGGGGAGDEGGDGGYGGGAGGGATPGAPGFAGGAAGADAGGGGAGLGGAIFVHGGALIAINSTLSGNRAVGGGGGGASGLGGGVFVQSGSAQITSVTIAGNLATTAGALYAQGGTISVGNSLLVDSGGDLIDCHVDAATLTESSKNLVERRDNCVLSTGVDPGLAPLASNGGFTQTRAIGTSSSAARAGMCSQTTDQRGETRITAPGVCDIGAYEIARGRLIILFDGNGSGTVTNFGSVSCQATCTVYVPKNTSTVLFAQAEPGSIFAGWDLACAGTDPCSVTVANTVTVVARFITEPPPTPDAAVSLPDASEGIPDAAVEPPDGGEAPDAPVDLPDAATAPDAAQPPDGPISTPDAAAAPDGAVASDGAVVVVDARAADATAADARLVDAAAYDARAADARGDGGPDAGRLLPLEPGCNCGVGRRGENAPGVFLLIGVVALVTRRRRPRA